MRKLIDFLSRHISDGLIFIVLLIPLTVGAGIFLETKIFIYVFLSSVFLLWLLKQSKKDCFEFTGTNLDKYLILFLLISFLSFYKLSNIHASIDGVFLFLSYFLFFWLVVNNFDSKDKIDFVLNGLIAIGSLVSIYGLWQYFYGLEDMANWAAFHNISVSTENRVFSTFISPNHLAGFLSLIFPIAFIKLLYLKNKIKSVLIGLGICLMGICLVLTYSRGGWISFATALLIILFGVGLFYKHPKKTINIAIILILLTSISIFFIIKNTSTKPSKNVTSYSAFNPDASAVSLEGRFQLWQGTINMIKKNYLLGTGIGTYSYVYPVYQYEGKYSKHAHNTFLEIFAETGFFGFLSFLFFMFLILKNHVSVIRFEEDKQYKLYALAFFAAGTSFIIRNLIDFDWYSPGETLVFWLFSGLTISIIQLSDNKTDKRVIKRIAVDNKLYKWKIGIVSVSIGIIIFLSISLLMYQANSFSEIAQDSIDEGGYNEAITNINRSIFFDPFQALYHSKLSEIYFKKSLTAKNKTFVSNAIDAAKKAVELEPYWSFYHYRLAVYYGAVGKIDLQEKELKKAVSLYINNPSYRKLLAEFYYSNKKYIPALEEYKKTVALLKYYRIDSTKISDNLPVYIKEPLRIIEQSYLGIGNTYVALNKLNEALTAYDKALGLDDSDQTAYFNKGFVYQKLEFWDKAIFNYEKTLKLKPEDTQALYNLAVVYEKVGRIKESKDLLEKAKNR